MLLDVISTEGYIITADRDEKIRVSLVDSPHVILSFCLGHAEFVTKTVAIKSTSTLISFSGDGTMRAWGMHTGKLLQTVSLLAENDKINASKLVPDVVSSTAMQNLFAVSFSGSNKVRIFIFKAKDEQPLTVSYDISLPTDQEVLDVSFAPSGSSTGVHDLFILSCVSGLPRCTVAKCQHDSYTICDNRPVTNFVTAISNCSLQKRYFSQYFRLKVESNVYEAFKRKQKQHKYAKKSKLSVSS